MWKCSNCETVNNGDKCIVCGEAKPAIQASQQTQAAQNTSNHNSAAKNEMSTAESYEKRSVPKTEMKAKPVKKSNGLLIGLSVTMIVLLIAIIILIFVFFMNNSDTNETIRRRDYDNSEEMEAPEDEADDFDDEEELEETEEPEPETFYGKVEEEETETVELSGVYKTYTNTQYNFYCAYPEDFHTVASEGVNALKTLESPDGAAIMTIRACPNSSGIGVDTAMSDFYSVVEGELGYTAKGDTWYVASADDNGRLLYRKCFLENGNIYCFDFEFDEEDMEIYSPCIEYIEDNFKPM